MALLNRGESATTSGSEREISVIAVTLNHPAASSQATVLLNPNRHGELPAVLVDPLDHEGKIIEGTWLGDGHDGTVFDLTNTALRART